MFYKDFYNTYVYLFLETPCIVIGKSIYVGLGIDKNTDLMTFV